MRSVELKVARIGNSRGVRLPAATITRYGIDDTVVMEERSDGILLRIPGPASPKLSWEETARQMAAEADEWGVWDAAVADGLDELPWDVKRPARVAESREPYGKRGRSRKR